jgi:hypothetical protein
MYVHKIYVLLKNSRQVWLVWLLPKPNRYFVVITEIVSYFYTNPYLTVFT